MAPSPEWLDYQQRYSEKYKNLIKAHNERVDMLNGARKAGLDAEVVARRLGGQANVDASFKKQLECMQRADELRNDLREQLREINGEDDRAPWALQPFRPIQALGETEQNNLVECGGTGSDLGRQTALDLDFRAKSCFPRGVR